MAGQLPSIDLSCVRVTPVGNPRSQAADAHISNLSPYLPLMRNKSSPEAQSPGYGFAAPHVGHKASKVLPSKIGFMT
jgi:hypothetical protein